MGMFRRALVAVALLALHAGAHAQGLYDTVNRLRQGECAGPDRPAPLVPQAALEQAAAALAQGGNLQQSLKDAAYRYTRSSVVSLRGDGVDAQAAEMLKKYCGQLADAGMREAGIFSDARQIWIVTAAPFAPQVALSEEAAGQRVLELINQARAVARRCGEKPFKAAPPVRWNATLALASRAHAEDMARNNFFSHDGRDGSKPAQRVARAGYKYRMTGENIAGGQMRPEEAVAGWIKSPPHCANLMNAASTEMGVAFAVDRTSKLGVYWAQEFGTPR
jgi:uncharacterized protein YkwD